MKIFNRMTIALLLMLLCHITGAVEIYQWTDSNGEVHFSDSFSEVKQSTIAYSSVEEGKVYRWKDKDDMMQISDIPPSNNISKDVEEIQIDVSSFPDDEKYSVINQAARMVEYTDQLRNKRLEKEREKLEKYQIAQQLEILRMEEQLRKYGYGPKPYY